MLKNVQNKQRAFIANPSLAQGRELLLTLGPAIVVILIAFLLAYRFMPPAPPKQVSIVTGGESGGYFAFGKRYAEVLGRHGVKVNVLTSAGSIENLKRLSDPASGIAAGLLQGGIGNSKDAPELLSIGRVFHEPLWVFYRGATIDKLSELKGKRIAVGSPGSGTRALSEELLKSSQVTAASATLLPISGQPAVDALRKDEADAVFLALAPEAPIVRDLMRDKSVKLMSFSQAEAYTKIFPYLARLTLPQGVFDLDANIPDRDIALVAPKAALVVQSSLHPAIIALLAEAAQEVHGKTSLFAKAQEFPTLQDPDFEMDPDALRYYKAGPTFWKRILPYWLANLVERTIVILVPLLTALIPLAKIVPVIYRWRFRRRLHYWYGRLKQVEQQVAELPRNESAEAAQLHGQLDELDDSVSRLPVPIQFAEQFYNMREHVNLVRRRLQQKVAAA